MWMIMTLEGAEISGVQVDKILNMDTISLYQTLSRIELNKDVAVSPDQNVFQILHEYLKMVGENGTVNVPDDNGELASRLIVDAVNVGWDFEVKGKVFNFKRGLTYLQCLKQVAAVYEAELVTRPWGILVLKNRKVSPEVIIIYGENTNNTTLISRSLGFTNKGKESFIVEEDPLISSVKFTNFLNSEYVRKNSLTSDTHQYFSYEFKPANKGFNVSLLNTTGNWSAYNLMEFYSICQGVEWTIRNVDKNKKSFVVYVNPPK